VTTEGTADALSVGVRGEAGQGALAGILAVGLTAASGATDAISFLRLGSVFTSVMTGNLVLLGVSVARRDGAQAAHALVAISAFAAGVAAASRIGGRAAGERPWSWGIGVALAVELAILCAFLLLWEGSHGRPSGEAQLVQLACAALALGVQSGAVRAMGIAGLSTTYFTGTLTALVGTSATGGRLDRRSAVLLAAVAVGATGGGSLAVGVPRVAPVLPVVLVLLVVVGWGAARARRVSRTGGAAAR
jgi:uncharacterized membrane protein YoaK (UPF0700 family)